MKPNRPSFVCASCARALRNATKSETNFTSSRAASTVTRINPIRTSSPESQSQLPRWKQTPAALKMPIRLRPQPKQPVWSVNTDDEKLNQAYDNFCGRVGGNKRGRDLLSDEVKWTAITHKSHSHGNQGFNDRLAYLGKRILDLQTSIALLSAPSPQNPSYPKSEVFAHPALTGLENVTQATKLRIVNSRRLSTLAMQYGLDKVIRWKPRRSDDLKASGQESVLAHTVFSIVGALAMQQGGEVAARAARERVLQPLGLR
ncbi:uncharacterized protein MYCFIDRAFT_211491 [Pseudocercospora fijiensis CIRAD86]|uniref:RNase III domain-containing protein n=1 Tax=Pseudocercospora fijiensis (strain CIRAD86) TaxID=383855 RepID=M3ABE0_PSEFD|nr:uncharacterized protein MYCFIDRAFT_211491 [Pseudocercospora fijiensis CIRAD86]EME81901.1 hypothetical protein MYCFIDRAFT_211491 [Pseudocercospora fijiensis CIRAD86]